VDEEKSECERYCENESFCVEGGHSFLETSLLMRQGIVSRGEEGCDAGIYKRFFVGKELMSVAVYLMKSLNRHLRNDG
jgi:hypothetical protein